MYHIYTVQGAYAIFSHIVSIKVYYSKDVVMPPEINAISLSNGRVNLLQVIGGEVYLVAFKNLCNCSRLPQGGWWGTVNGRRSIICGFSDV